MTTIDTNTFEAAIKSSKLPVIIVFVMEGTVASSRMLKRAGEIDPTKFTVLKVDVDKSPTLVHRFSIRTVPYLIKFDPDGTLLAAGKVLSTVMSETI